MMCHNKQTVWEHSKWTTVSGFVCDCLNLQPGSISASFASPCFAHDNMCGSPNTPESTNTLTHIQWSGGIHGPPKPHNPRQRNILSGYFQQGEIYLWLLHRFWYDAVHYKANQSKWGQPCCITSRTINTFSFGRKRTLQGCLQKRVRGPRKLLTPLDPIWDFVSLSRSHNKTTILWWPCASIRNGQYAECERQLRGPLRGHRGVACDNIYIYIYISYILLLGRVYACLPILALRTLS